ncbi:hypothetical protein ABC304_11845 [Microbacterium sp. 1P10UB]|uniref:hypothetical protein n=1 Tax=unclassified Microbacterium TaxID=2609290 RepID=UPI0039A1ACBE
MRLPYTEVRFDEKGAPAEPDQLDEAASLVSEKNATDVILLSHGWNNTPAQARDLYERIVASMVAVRDRVPGATERRIVIVGMIWPSIQWAAEEDSGAGAGIQDDAAVLAAEVRARVEDDATATRLVALIPRLRTDSAAQSDFVALLRGTLPRSTKGEDEAAFTALKTADPSELFEAAKDSGSDAAAPAAVGGAADIDPAGLAPLEAGGAAGFFDGLVSAARNLLNVTTYYTMKERAGVVGRKGMARLLGELHAAAPDARLHLVGHSFGGRAVTAAALAADAPVSSLSLLQAAYSHFGMAHDWDDAGTDGLFAAVPARIRGPVLVTFTHNDKAVGVAYPVASRLARQVGAGLGDENDPYGGIGRNGALKTPASLPATDLIEVGGAYAFRAGHVSSLRADAFVSGHSDIAGRQVAYAVLTAITSA